MSQCAFNADVISETYEDMSTGKRQIRRFQRPYSGLKTDDDFQFTYVADARMDGLWATKSEGVGLIVRAISFQDFQSVWS